MKFYEFEIRREGDNIFVTQPLDGFDDQTIILSLDQLQVFIDMLIKVSAESADAVV